MADATMRVQRRHVMMKGIERDPLGLTGRPVCEGNATASIMDAMAQHSYALWRMLHCMAHSESLVHLPAHC